MKRSLQSLLALTAVADVVGLLGGCATGPGGAKTHATDSQYQDFGRSVRQDIAAQIADPDPAWKKDPPPATSGKRAALALKAYEVNSVRRSQVTTSQIGGQAAESGGVSGTTGP